MALRFEELKTKAFKSHLLFDGIVGILALVSVFTGSDIFESAFPEAQYAHNLSHIVTAGLAFAAIISERVLHHRKEKK